MPRARQSRGANTSFFAFQDIITSVTGILILIVIMLILMIRQPGVILDPVDPKERRSLEELTGLIEKAISEIRKLAATDLDVGNKSEEELRNEISEFESELEKGIDPLRMGLVKEVEAAQSELVVLEKEEIKLAEKKTTSEEALAEAEETLEKMKLDYQDNLDSSQVWLSNRRGKRKPIVIELDSRGGVLRDLREVEKKILVPQNRLKQEVRQLAQRNNSGDSYFVFFIRPSGILHLDPLKQILVDKGYNIGYRALDEQTELKLLPEEKEEEAK